MQHNISKVSELCVGESPLFSREHAHIHDIETRISCIIISYIFYRYLIILCVILIYRFQRYLILSTHYYYFYCG